MKQGRRKLCAIAVATSILALVFTTAWNPRIGLQRHFRKTRNLRKKQSIAFTFKNWKDESASLTGLLEAPSTKSKGVIYNRVGKCGSRSLIKIIEAVSARNRFQLVGVHENLNRRLTLVQQIDFVTFVERVKAPFVYHQHVRFVDFRRFAATQPYYINLIRDPLKRLVSQYYFRRFGDGRKEKRRGFKGTAQEFNQTFDECVLNKSPECTDTRKMFALIPYFCGQQAACSRPTQWALRQAKLNVVNNYLVVGILEEFKEFLIVLEKILPAFFGGAVDTWRSPGPTLKTKMAQTETNYKKEPSPSVVKIVRQYLQLEYQFYDFVKETFHALRTELGVNTGNLSTSIHHKLTGKNNG